MLFRIDGLCSLSLKKLLLCGLMISAAVWEYRRRGNVLAEVGWYLHAAGQTEGRGDGGEDGDDHVDDQLPGFFLAFL